MQVAAIRVGEERTRQERTGAKDLNLPGSLELSGAIGGIGAARCGGRLGVKVGQGATVHKQEEVDTKDGDQNESANEDVRPEPEHGFVAGEIGGWDVSGLVIAFMHGDKSRRKGCGVGKYRLTALIWAIRRGRGGT
jgi:hypothetical protein